GLETQDVLYVFDSEGRFNPKLLEGTESTIDSGTIILAIGQMVDKNSLSLDPKLKLNPNGTIEVNVDTLATNLPGVYAGGDAAFGPRIVIDSVANGRTAARSIMEYLSDGLRSSDVFHFERLNTNSYVMPDGFEKRGRTIIPQTPVDRRVGFAEVEQCYTDDQAREESERCLKCNINTIFDSDTCILCAGCVDVCPENCLELVESSQIKVFEHHDAETSSQGREWVIIKDETRCIRCALCAKRCPTGSITMERLIFDEYTNALRQRYGAFQRTGSP
ncbi:MAG: 4Fe-4S binding protein, partial [Planctomycetota bacterium]